MWQVRVGGRTGRGDHYIKCRAPPARMGCVFCEIIGGESEAATIYEDADVVVIMDRYPIDTGHCLVITREHRETISDMDPAGVGRVFGTAHAIAGAVLKGLGADAFSIAQNNGRAAKQVVPHVHVHVIPRYNSTGTDWSAGRKVASMGDLERLAARIRPHIEADAVGAAAAEAGAAAERAGIRRGAHQAAPTP